MGDCVIPLWRVFALAAVTGLGMLMALTPFVAFMLWQGRRDQRRWDRQRTEDQGRWDRWRAENQGRWDELRRGMDERHEAFMRRMDERRTQGWE
jgi:hypothetical protein